MSSSSESSHPPKVLCFPVSCGTLAVAWLGPNGKMGCRSVPPTCQVQIPHQITPNAQSSWVCSTGCPTGHMLCCSGVYILLYYLHQVGMFEASSALMLAWMVLDLQRGLKVRSPVGTG